MVYHNVAEQSFCIERVEIYRLTFHTTQQKDLESAENLKSLNTFLKGRFSSLLF